MASQSEGHQILGGYSDKVYASPNELKQCINRRGLRLAKLCPDLSGEVQQCIDAATAALNFLNGNRTTVSLNRLTREVNLALNTLNDRPEYNYDWARGEYDSFKDCMIDLSSRMIDESHRQRLSQQERDTANRLLGQVFG